MNEEELDKYRDEEKEDKNDNFVVVKQLTKEDYENYFRKYGFKKSEKFVNMIKRKVISYGTNYNNADRKYYISQLKVLKEPYYKVFKKSII